MHYRCFDFHLVQEGIVPLSSTMMTEVTPINRPNIGPSPFIYLVPCIYMDMDMDMDGSYVGCLVLVGMYCTLMYTIVQ